MLGKRGQRLKYVKVTNTPIMNIPSMSSMVTRAEELTRWTRSGSGSLAAATRPTVKYSSSSSSVLSERTKMLEQGASLD